jgi:hypothetical protein
MVTISNWGLFVLLPMSVQASIWENAAALSDDQQQALDAISAACSVRPPPPQVRPTPLVGWLRCALCLWVWVRVRVGLGFSRLENPNPTLNLP